MLTLRQFMISQLALEKYIDFPESLIGSYQSYTKADLTNLSSVKYNCIFNSLEAGIFKYLDILNDGIDLNID